MFPFTFGDEEINLDETVTVSCTITKGDLPLLIWWSVFDPELGFERNLTTNDGVMITRSSQKISYLAIDAVKSRHRANYTCHAHNKAGSAQHSAYLAINGDFKKLLLHKSLQFVSPKKSSAFNCSFVVWR